MCTSAINALPKIVCDAITQLELADKPPSWKIMDNKGNVTVVLHWDQKDRPFEEGGPVSWRVEVTSSQAATDAQPPRPPSGRRTPTPTQFVTYTTAPSTFQPSAQPRPASAGLVQDGYPGAAIPLRTHLRPLPLPRLGIESEDDDIQISPIHDHAQCDFHCSALHRGGGRIQVTNRSAATSPIHDIAPGLITSTFGAPGGGGLAGLAGLAGLSGISVSADNIHAQAAVAQAQAQAQAQAAAAAAAATAAHATGAIPKQRPSTKPQVRFADVVSQAKINGNNQASEESETETTEKEEETVCERYLQLVDSINSESQEKHLSIKDIGIILERLSSKIVDVERLERDKESADCHTWVIKATIRGETMREIGVIYNGRYYGITEHPAYF